MPPVHIEPLLTRVVEEVFGDEVDATFSMASKYEHDWRASLVSKRDPSMVVTIRATYAWFTANIPAYGVGTISFEYDDDEIEKEAVLRELALVMLAYLRGNGSLAIKRGWFSLRKKPSITIDVDGKRWVLGRRTSSIEDLRLPDQVYQEFAG